MRQLPDDDLILYFYGEAENPEEIRELLAGSPELLARYQSLCLTLETAREAFPVPPRAASYGGEVWARLRPRLDKDEKDNKDETSPLPPLPVRWAGRGRERRAGVVRALWAAAAVLLLVVGFLAGRLLPPPPGRPETAASVLPPEARERILVQTVAAHLESSERLLTEVTNTGTDDTVDLSAECQWARDLLAANRLYRQSAERAGRPRLTALLDEIEPFLLELAHSPNEVASDEIADLRARLQEQALLFKVRVVGRRLAGATAGSPAGKQIL